MTNGIHPGVQRLHNRFRRVTLIVLIALSVYWVAIFYATHMKLPPDVLPGDSDKVVHFLAYAVLGALLIGVRASRGSFLWKSVFNRWFVLAAYGAFDELTQMLVNRTADFHDWFADITGAALGLGVVTFAVWLSRPKTHAG